MANMIEILLLPLLACVAMTLILSHLGIHVLKREVVFIDIALAQVAALGAISAHLVIGTAMNSPLSYLFALGATFLAAAFFAYARKVVKEIPLEAVIGVTYAIAAGATLFVVGAASGGHVHVQEVLAGSILWTTWGQLTACAITFGLVGLCFFLFRRPFNRISEDYEQASAHGLKPARWDFLFYALFGVVITQSVRVAGVVVVFAFLIIPATASALFFTSTGPRLVMAWGIGLAATLMGLFFAYQWDYSVGPSVAMFLGLLLALGGIAQAGLSRLKVLHSP